MSRTLNPRSETTWIVSSFGRVERMRGLPWTRNNSVRGGRSCILFKNLHVSHTNNVLNQPLQPYQYRSSCVPPNHRMTLIEMSPCNATAAPLSPPPHDRVRSHLGTRRSSPYPLGQESIPSASSPTFMQHQAGIDQATHTLMLPSRSIWMPAVLCSCWTIQ